MTPTLQHNDVILIDNGHGSDTPGKCSPDGKFLECETESKARRSNPELRSD